MSLYKPNNSEQRSTAKESMDKAMATASSTMQMAFWLSIVVGVVLAGALAATWFAKGH